MARLVLIANNKEIVITNDEELTLSDMLLAGPFAGYVVDDDGNILAIKGILTNKTL